MWANSLFVVAGNINPQRSGSHHEFSSMTWWTWFMWSSSMYTSAFTVKKSKGLALFCLGFLNLFWLLLQWINLNWRALYMLSAFRENSSVYSCERTRGKFLAWAWTVSLFFKKSCFQEKKKFAMWTDLLLLSLYACVDIAITCVFMERHRIVEPSTAVVELSRDDFYMNCVLENTQKETNSCFLCFTQIIFWDKVAYQMCKHPCSDILNFTGSKSMGFV